MVLWFIMQTERLTCLLVCCCRWYCGSDGLALPTDECDPGWYCTGGAESARPSDALQGGQCQAGNFCPRGSAVQLPCTPGYYCLDVGKCCISYPVHLVTTAWMLVSVALTTLYIWLLLLGCWLVCCISHPLTWLQLLGCW